MGLDMYLENEIYVGANYEHNHVTGNIDLTVRDKKLTVPLHKVKTIILDAGYWRKANAIHNWFVENVQEGNDDCGRYYVSTDALQQLLDTVNTVLASAKMKKGKIGARTVYKNGTVTQLTEPGKVMADPSVAMELLPSASGFFFGSTDYDQYYVDDLKLTKKILEEALAADGDYYYQSSW